MNNKEINEAIARIRYDHVNVEDSDGVWVGRKYDGLNVVSVLGIYNPVENIQQAMDLLIEEKINVDWIQKIVLKDGNSVKFTDETDLPFAICSIYLQVKNVS